MIFILPTSILLGRKTTALGHQSKIYQRTNMQNYFFQSSFFLTELNYEM